MRSADLGRKGRGYRGRKIEAKYCEVNPLLSLSLSRALDILNQRQWTKAGSEPVAHGLALKAGILWSGLRRMFVKFFKIMRPIFFSLLTLIVLIFMLSHFWFFLIAFFFL